MKHGLAEKIDCKYILNRPYDIRLILDNIGYSLANLISCTSFLGSNLIKRRRRPKLALISQFCYCFGVISFCVKDKSEVELKPIFLVVTYLKWCDHIENAFGL